ncbi:unnamed protein product, partial [Prorocentrum cordatum]
RFQTVAGQLRPAVRAPGELHQCVRPAHRQPDGRHHGDLPLQDSQVEVRLLQRAVRSHGLVLPVHGPQHQQDLAEDPPGAAACQDRGPHARAAPRRPVALRGGPVPLGLRRLLALPAAPGPSGGRGLRADAGVGRRRRGRAAGRRARGR